MTVGKSVAQIQGVTLRGVPIQGKDPHTSPGDILEVLIVQKWDSILLLDKVIGCQSYIFFRSCVFRFLQPNRLCAEKSVTNSLVSSTHFLLVSVSSPAHPCFFQPHSGNICIACPYGESGRSVKLVSAFFNSNNSRLFCPSCSKRVECSILGVVLHC